MTGKTMSLAEMRRESLTPGFLPEGELSRTRECLSHMRDRASFLSAAGDDMILEAPCVLCDCGTMQLTVELPGGIRGVIPREEAAYQADGSPVRDIAIITRVGKPVQFKVREILPPGASGTPGTSDGSGRMTAILSRRDAQKACADAYLKSLLPGDIIPAKVTHLEPFGAFCDIGCGLVSLLTVDRISVSRIAHPSERFSVGDSIDAVVSSIEDSGRIYLSHRELLGTWEENAAAFSPGQTVTGIVRSIEHYGVFVELAPNLAGLAEAFPGAHPGDACSVYIKSILPERMKIKLVLIDTCGPADRMPLRYYLDPAIRHLDRWRYSPPGSRKLVETVFR